MEASLTGSYELLDRLGKGGMAEVFRARAFGEAGFTRMVAIKRVLPQLSQSQRFSEMFTNEARIASRLTHPNIVSVMNFARDANDQLFLVMELVEGTDLFGLMNTGQVPVTLTPFIVGEVLRALAYAHKPRGAGQPGIIHRDISPQNVLISWEGAVKVSDFGIAKAHVLTDDAPSLSIKGKLGYLSPEQVSGVQLDGRADLFATGVIFWELLSGSPLFSGASDAEIIAQMTSRDVPPPGVSPALDEVCLKLLARDREQRYPSAEAALAALAATGTIDPLGGIALSKFLRERMPDHSPSAQLFAVSSKPDPKRMIVFKNDRPQVTEAAPATVARAHSAAPAEAARSGGTDKGVIIAAAAAVLAAVTAAGLYFSSPSSEAPPVVAPVVPVAPPPPPPPPPPPQPVAVDAGVAEDAGAAVAAVPAKPGRIKATADPWATVSVDGKQSGNTPRIIEVSPGPHTVTLRNEEQGTSYTETVTVESGKTIRVHKSW